MKSSMQCNKKQEEGTLEGYLSDNAVTPTVFIFFPFQCFSSLPFVFLLSGFYSLS